MSQQNGPDDGNYGSSMETEGGTVEAPPSGSDQV